MDISSIMTTLLSSDSVSGLSKKTGASKNEVTSVLTSALPMLLQGAQSQADDEETAAGFEKALEDHSNDDTSNLLSFMNGVDLEDGAKIIGHLLGGNTSSTTKKVSKSSGASADSTAQIMSAAAPLLMSLLGQSSKSESKTKKKSSSGTGDLMGQLVSTALANVDVGSLLTGLLTDKKTTKKKTTSAKKTTTTAKKSTSTAKKTTTAKKSTTAKKTTTKKKAASDGLDLGDVAGLLTKLLK